MPPTANFEEETMSELSFWLYHRGGADQFRAIGTAAEARVFLRHLNAGRTERLYAMRGEAIRSLNIAAEQAKLKLEANNA
jgi:hypothetical protein